MATDRAVNERGPGILDAIVKRKKTAELLSSRNSSDGLRITAAVTNVSLCTTSRCTLPSVIHIHVAILCDVKPGRRPVTPAEPRVTSPDHIPVPDLFEDSLPLPAQAYLKVCSALSEVSLNEAKSRDPPPTTDSPAKEDMLPTPGTKVKRTSVLHTQEIVRSFEYLKKTNVTFLSFVFI